MLAKPAHPTPYIRHETCPSCGKRSVFRYAGEQRIPPRLTRRNSPSAYTLWNCAGCHSTISEYAFPRR